MPTNIQCILLKYMEADPNEEKETCKLVMFDKIIECAKLSSKGFQHVRVDFYEVDGKMYFGELTFYHFSGFMPFQPEQ